MESEISRTLRYILSAFDLLTDIEKRELITELQTRAGMDPAKPTDI